MPPLDRRRFLVTTGAAALATSGLGGLLFSRAARAEIGATLIVALPGGPVRWDPLTADARDPWVQSIWNAVLGAYLERGPDLALQPGLFESWDWSNDAGTEARLVLRPGLRWHDGRPLGPKDVIWNLKRAVKAEKNSPQDYWTNIKEFAVADRAVVLRLGRHAPDLFDRFAFRAVFPLPPHLRKKKKSARSFAKAPVGAGPYRVERPNKREKKSDGGDVLRLRAVRDHWAGPPAFERVDIRFMPDPDDRAAALESGEVHVAAGLPAAEMTRIADAAGIATVSDSIAEMAVVQLNDIHPMTDPKVRRAANLAIHRTALVERLLGGQGAPLAGLELPGALAHDPDLTAPYEPERAVWLLAQAGYSTVRPARLALQTTRGHRPGDFETAQAIAGMWQRVGIAAEIEVLDAARIAKLAAWDRLAPACLRVWDNATGDPNNGTGALLWGGSPDSIWDSDELDDRLVPLMRQRADPATRRDGWRALGRDIAGQALVLPLYQYKQGIAFRRGLALAPHGAGWILPQLIGREDS